MAYRLYGNRQTGSCSIACVLAEIGADYDTVTVSLRTEDHRQADYRAINPSGKVPALALPDGTVVTESAAILITLADRHPEAELLPPPGSSARAIALRWLVYLVAEVYSMIEVNDFPQRFVDGEDPAVALRTRARSMLRERWLPVEAAIAGTPWLLPSGPTITDFHIATMSRWSLGKAWRIETLPKVEAVTAAVAAHPRAGPVWHAHFHDRVD